MRHPIAWLFASLLSACAGPASFVAPPAAGKPGSEVSKLVAASEARLFPCTIMDVRSAREAVDLGGARVADVTLLPGTYRVTLLCTSGYHQFEPQADVTARMGKTYRITGYLVDDSITIFTMKMRVKVAESP